MEKHKWIICSCCEGNGAVENPAFRNGFTSSEWAEMAADEQAEYMRGDTTCPARPAPARARSRCSTSRL